MKSKWSNLLCSASLVLPVSDEEEEEEYEYEEEDEEEEQWNSVYFILINHLVFFFEISGLILLMSYNILNQEFLFVKSFF